MSNAVFQPSLGHSSTRSGSGYFESCFNGERCDHRPNNDGLSNVQTLGAPGLTRTLFQAAASSSSSSVTATSTQTITKTSLAYTKTTSSLHLPAAPSQTVPMISSSQTSSTTSSIQASFTTSATSSQTATRFAATSPVTALTVHPSPSSHSDTAAVAAGTVGAIVGAIIVLILMLLILRWRKRRAEDKLQATQHDNDLQSQNFDANGAGSAFQISHVSGKSWNCTRVTPFPTKLSQHGASKRYLLDCMIISLVDLADMLTSHRIRSCIQRRQP